ncbi:MAG: glycosyltransferase family 9 protein, partial [candidate division Zixibacteria bacterium]|nr:glycosyltransferase family 9 protein [candidate division Zixibacteria bacterium]
GGPGDEWIITSFADLKVIDLVGKTSLVELVALYRKCDAVITHDSGPMHLAGLAGAPLVALFGPTNPYEKVPRNGLHEILWGGEDLACRPCYDGKGYDNCQDNLCMKQISVVEVFNAINSVSIGGPSVNRN